MVVEGHARGDHVHESEAPVSQPGLDERHQLLLISGEASCNKRGTQRKRQRRWIDRGHLVCFTAFGLAAYIRRRRKLTLGQSVYTIVLQHIKHVHVTAHGVAELTQPDGERIAVPGNSDVGKSAVCRIRTGGDGWHTAMEGVESVGLTEKVGGRLGRTSDPAQLRDPVRWGVELKKRLNDRRGDRIMTAPGAEGRLSPLVIPLSQTKLVLPEARMSDRRFGCLCH